MEHIVLDSSILVASFVESDKFHQRSLNFTNGLESGDYIFHLPMLVLVEVIAAINHRLPRNHISIVARAKKSISDWERDGKVFLYALDRNRMDKAVNTAERHRLRGSDAVIAALAEELDIPLKTFDTEVLARFLRASV